MNQENMKNVSEASDLYFKDCLTKIDDQTIDAKFNQATVKCLSSADNTFHLDCEGNLTVNSIVAKKMTIPVDMIYPIGSIYISTSSTNPNSLFGGTWEAFATGRTLVGIDPSQTEFASVQKTGGSKLLQSHSHSWSGTTSENGNHSHTLYSGYGSGGTYGQDGIEFKQGLSGRNYYSAGTGGVPFLETTGNHSHTISGTTSANGSGNAQNLQPYIVVYMWRRVA